VLAALPELLAARAPTEAFVLERLRRNLAALRRGVAGGAVSVLPVEGGWYAVLRLPRTRSEEAWVLGLLCDRGVLVQPGYFFDFAEEAFVVVSLLTPEAELDRGVERLAEYAGRG
jgi:alanine-synthesizing transaminase